MDKKDNFPFCLCALFEYQDDAAAAKSDELVVDRSYVKKKLEHGLTRIWQVVCFSVFLSLHV